MSPDPVVQNPKDVQAYNRYAYVRNNPMTNIDPSGYSWIGDNKHRIGEAFVRYGQFQMLMTPVTGGASFWPGVINVAVGQHLMGDTRGAAITVFTAVATAGFNTYFGVGTTKAIVANSVVGGIAAEMQGGKFQHGFAASLATQSIRLPDGSDPYLQVGVAALVGGTVSEATGGKFKNGAATAALQELVSVAAEAAPSSGNGDGNGKQPSKGRQALYKALKVTHDTVATIWNLPNTIVGLGYAGVGHLVGETMQMLDPTKPEPSIVPSWDNMAIQFLNNPFTMSATALGNVVLYGGGTGSSNSPSWEKLNGFTLGYEEKQHVIQGGALGIFYLPAHGVLGTLGMMSTGSMHGWHSDVNFLEKCPHAMQPSPWGC